MQLAAPTKPGWRVKKVSTYASQQPQVYLAMRWSIVHKLNYFGHPIIYKKAIFFELSASYIAEFFQFTLLDASATFMDGCPSVCLQFITTSIF